MGSLLSKVAKYQLQYTNTHTHTHTHTSPISKSDVSVRKVYPHISLLQDSAVVMTMLAVCAIVESYGIYVGDYNGHVGNNVQKLARDTGDYQVSSFSRNESN